LSNVIGPISYEDWMLMRTLVRNIPEKEKDPHRYRTTLPIEKSILSDYKKKYLTFS
jgi:hypothetical protein